MTKRPFSPSIISVSPSRTSLEAVPRATTAGMFRLCAKSAVWLVLPPASVQKPITWFSCRLMVSDGYKLCATSKEGFLMEAKNPRSSPSKLLTSRLPTSKISLRRSLKNGSSIFSNWAASSCSVNKMAACALKCSVVIFLVTLSERDGSCKMSLWAESRLAYSPPSSPITFCSHVFKSESVFCTAAFSLRISFLTSEGST